MTDAMHDFIPAEYHARRAALAAHMREQGLAAILINSEPNHRYVTGHWSARYINTSRPIFGLLTAAGEATILCSRLEIGMAELTATDCAIRPYDGAAANTRPMIEALAALVRELGGEGGRIGIEAGNNMRFTLPLGGFRHLESLTPGIAYEDASALLWRERRIKSEAELAYLRQAAGITTAGFAQLFSRPLEGRTEEEVQRELSRFMLEQGADRVGFITANADTSGTYPGGYGDKTFERGQLGNIDSGCVVRGYWADFCRNCTPGHDDSGLEDAARVMAHYVEVSLAEIRAGRTAAEVADHIGQEMRKRTNGRFPDEKTDVMHHFGHGLGLQMPEPPFLCPDDETVLRPGMVVCLEPSFIHPSAGTLIGEETVVVREAGCELLTDGGSAAVQVTG